MCPKAAKWRQLKIGLNWECWKMLIVVTAIIRTVVIWGSNSLLWGRQTWCFRWIIAGFGDLDERWSIFTQILLESFLPLLIPEGGWMYVLTKKPIKRWNIFQKENWNKDYHIREVKSSEVGNRWGINEYLKQQFQNVSIRTCCSPTKSCTTITRTPKTDLAKLEAIICLIMCCLQTWEWFCYL